MGITAGSLPTRLMAIAASAAVAMSLMPLPALADEISAARVSQGVSVQASNRVNVYVVTKVTGVDPSYASVEYEYGDDGLIVKRTMHPSLKSRPVNVMNYQYKKSRLVSATRQRVSSQWSDDEKVTYTYDKKGNLTQTVRSVVMTELVGEDAGDVQKNTTINKATYDKSGRIINFRSKLKLTVDGKTDNPPYSVVSYKSHNKKGRPTKAKMSKTGPVLTYYYDKRGNLTHTSSAHPSEKFRLKYDKKGNLVKRSVYDTDFKETTEVIKYTYKKVSVPKSCAKAVKEQQYDIVNPSVNPMLTFG